MKLFFIRMIFCAVPAILVSLPFIFIEGAKPVAAIFYVGIFMFGINVTKEI